MLNTMISGPYPRTIPREEIESYVSYLSQKFPKCFFVDARLRRPLKKGIEDDLAREGVLDAEKRTAAVSFYTRNWTYRAMLQAGTERVDLNGHKAGTVSPQEHLDAQRQLQHEKQIEAARRSVERELALNSTNPIAVMSKLHANRQITTDQLSKVTISKVTVPPKKPTLTFGRLQKLVETLNTTAADTSDEELKQALVTATLQILISEAQQLIERKGFSPA